MDRIEFIVDPVAANSRRRVDVIVNGTRLEELVRRIEEPLAEREGTPSIAGKYVGLGLEDVAPPSRVLFGDASKTQFEYGHRTQVLGCDCGEAGCWPLVCQISFDEATVRWSDFRQPHRSGRGASSEWLYAGLGPFIFERASYEAAVEKLRNVGSGSGRGE